MKRSICIFMMLPLLQCCMEMSGTYTALNTLKVTAMYPEGYSSFRRAGVEVTAENVSNGYLFRGETSDDGSATITLPNGIYRVSVSDRIGTSIFNGASDRVRVCDGNESIDLPLVYSKAGTLVIKEVYTGGCSKFPQEGTYQSDKYFIIHNNDSRTAYLDSLCFGTLFPWNSTSSNPWSDNPAYTLDNVVIGQAIWQFGGDGTTFPLAPGEDAVVVLCGAIDHSMQYPLSVNLNNEDYFVVYNLTYLTMTSYHPAPGDRIRQERIIGCPEYFGQAKAVTISMSSPTLVLFRPEGMTIQEYLSSTPQSQVPGGSEKVRPIPVEWVIDGMEAFNGASVSNSKRLSTKVDAGYVSFSEVYKGRTLMRRTDEAASAEKGYEVLMDTNNSTTDFYERETQSLHK
jgi:hypothetical protein